MFIPHAAKHATFGLRQPELPLFKTLGFPASFESQATRWHEPF